MKNQHTKVAFVLIVVSFSLVYCASSNCKSPENSLCSKCEPSQYSKIETCVGKCSKPAQKFCRVQPYNGNTKQNETICQCGTNLKNCQVSIDNKICDICETGYATVYKTDKNLVTSTCVKDGKSNNGDKNTCKKSTSNIFSNINPIQSCKNCESLSGNKINCTVCNSGAVKVCDDSVTGFNGRICRCSNSDNCKVKNCGVCVNPDIPVNGKNKKCAMCKPGYTTVWQDGKDTVCRSGAGSLRMISSFTFISLLFSML